MRETAQADVTEFHDDYGHHPLGDHVDSKAVGPYIIELYDRPLDLRDRDERRDSPRSVLSVWVRDPDHWRPYRDVFSQYIGRLGAHDMFRSVDSVDTVAEWTDSYSGDS
jgi:hypothetical protein